MDCNKDIFSTLAKGGTYTSVTGLEVFIVNIEPDEIVLAWFDGFEWMAKGFDREKVYPSLQPKTTTKEYSIYQLKNGELFFLELADGLTLDESTLPHDAKLITSRTVDIVES